MSPDRVGFALSSTGPGESQDHSKRLFRAGPEFAQHRFAARSDEVAEDQPDDDRIVELPGHWNEVRDEVEGQAEIGTCVLTAAADHEPGEEGGVDRKHDAERDQEPCPPLHASDATRPQRRLESLTVRLVRGKVEPRWTSLFSTSNR
jgi:hypothetical protein